MSKKRKRTTPRSPSGGKEPVQKKDADSESPWWRRPAGIGLGFLGGIAVAAGSTFGSNIGEAVFSAASSHSSLVFSFQDATATDGSDEQAVVSPGIRQLPKDIAALFPSNAINVGTKVIRLTITNEYSQPARITDIQLSNIRESPPVSGTLFQMIPQGTVGNDILGISLSQRPAVLRHASGETGALGDPFFRDSSISIGPHDSEVLIIQMYAGSPNLYTWNFQISYDTGDGVKSTTPPAAPGLLELTGYTHSYERIYENSGQGWGAGPAATNYCHSVGDYCFGDGK